MPVETCILDEYVKEVLEEERERPDQICDDVGILLEDEGEEAGVRDTIVGYPTTPLYKCMAAMLNQWMETKHCPALDLPKYEMLDEKTYTEYRSSVIASVTPLLTGLKSLWQDWTREEIKFRIREVLVNLGKRGIMDLLGMTKMKESLEKFPPPRRYLLAAFCERAALYSGLYKGSDMLESRLGPRSWWGKKFHPSDMRINLHAEKKLDEILDNATFINVKWLTFQTYRLTVKQKDGYGVQFSFWENDTSFLYFLNPDEH